MCVLSHDAAFFHTEDDGVGGFGGEDQLGILLKGKADDLVAVAGNDHVAVGNVVHQHVAVAFDNDCVGRGVLKDVIADAIALARNGQCGDGVFDNLLRAVFGGGFGEIPKDTGGVKIVALDGAVFDVQKGNCRMLGKLGALVQASAVAHKVGTRDLQIMHKGLASIDQKAVIGVVGNDAVAEARVVGGARGKIHADAAAVHVTAGELAGVYLRLFGNGHCNGKTAEGDLVDLALIGSGGIKGETCTGGGIVDVKIGARVHAGDVALNTESIDQRAADHLAVAHANGGKTHTVQAYFGAVAGFEHAVGVGIACPDVACDLGRGKPQNHRLGDVVATAGQAQPSAALGEAAQCRIDARRPIGRAVGIGLGAIARAIGEGSWKFVHRGNLTFLDVDFIVAEEKWNVKEKRKTFNLQKYRYDDII